MFLVLYFSKGSLVKCDVNDLGGICGLYCVIFLYLGGVVVCVVLNWIDVGILIFCVDCRVNRL